MRIAWVQKEVGTLVRVDCVQSSLFEIGWIYEPLFKVQETTCRPTLYKYNDLREHVHCPSRKRRLLLIGDQNC